MIEDTTILHTYNLVNYMVEEPLILESGDTIRDLRIRYSTFGELNADKSNVVWVFHALTANSDPTEWWPGLVGEGALINPEDHFVICANTLGSCYGSHEPDSTDFPVFTVKDIVSAHQKLRTELGIDRIKLGIGGSMGGQQLLEWAVQEPNLFEVIVPIATNAVHSPWGIAFNEAQRMALSHPNREQAIATARAIAMLSYRSYRTFDLTQKDQDSRSDHYSASSYQRYQGQKLADRFSYFSYYYLTKAMDSHNVGRHFGGLEDALKRINAKTIAIGIESDELFPIEEQEYIANHVSNASFHVVHSDYGHDGFLIETEAISEIIRKEINE